MIRRRTPDAEGLLWSALSEALPRAKFRARVQMGPYVAAFASQSARLIVEVDFGRHRGDRGQARTRFLNGQGYRLIRFRHDDVMRDMDAVLDAIACALPAELLDECGPACRISGPAARADWSPRPDLPAGRPSPAEAEL